MGAGDSRLRLFDLGRERLAFQPRQQLPGRNRIADIDKNLDDALASHGRTDGNIVAGGEKAGNVLPGVETIRR